MRMFRNLGAMFCLLAVSAGLMLIASTDTAAKDTDMARFEWTSTNSAPAAYPVELLRAELTLADGTDYYIPDRRVIHHGWGKPGATHFVGAAEKALPVRLSATWFSYVEDRFYEIDTELPADAFLELANQGIESPRRGTKHAYDRFVFGFGPEGEGAIWMSAHSNMIDVFRFKGTQAQTDWSELIDNADISRAEFIAIILEEALGVEGAENAQKAGYTPGTWPRRQQRWDWALKVSGASDVSLFKFSALNGEVFHFLDDLEPNIDQPDHGAPQEIVMHWTGTAGQARSATLRFDPDETLQAFEQISANGDAMVLHVELSESANAVAVTLETDAAIYEFEQIQTEIFSR